MREIRDLMDDQLFRLMADFTTIKNTETRERIIELVRATRLNELISRRLSNQHRPAPKESSETSMPHLPD